MSYVVLWSSLDLDIFAPNISRLNNAYIESSNKDIKYRIFQGNGQSSIADRVRELHKEENKTLGVIEVKQNMSHNKKSRKETKYPEVASNPYVVETSKKKGQSNRKRKTKVDISGLIKIAENIVEEETKKTKKTKQDKNPCYEEMKNQ